MDWSELNLKNIFLFEINSFCTCRLTRSSKLHMLDVVGSRALLTLKADERIFSSYFYSTHVAFGWTHPKNLDCILNWVFLHTHFLKCPTIHTRTTKSSKWTESYLFYNHTHLPKFHPFFGRFLFCHTHTTIIIWSPPTTSFYCFAPACFTFLQHPVNYSTLHFEHLIEAKLLSFTMQYFWMKNVKFMKSNF